MSDKLKDKALDELFEGILTLKTVEECYAFFEDLCTVVELKDMGQRFQVAKMLNDGRVYTDITRETKVSTATIGRVNRSLNYGSDGYRMVISRLAESKE